MNSFTAWYQAFQSVDKSKKKTWEQQRQDATNKVLSK